MTQNNNSWHAAFAEAAFGVPMTSNAAHPQIDDIIPLIYQGPLESTPWQNFLNSLRIRFDCDVAAISLRPAKPGLRAVTVWDRRSPLTDTEQAKARLEHARLAHLDPLGNALRRPGDIFTLDEVISPSDLPQNEFYRSVILPFHIERQMGMYITEPGGWNCHLGLMSNATRANFCKEDKKILLELRPHFEHALKMYARLKRAELQKEIYEEALGNLTIGTIILDGRGKVIDSNHVAREIIKNNKEVALTDDGFQFSKSKHRTEFKRLFNEALERRECDDTPPFVGAFPVESQSGSLLGVLLRSAPTSKWFQNDVSPSVIVYLGDLEKQHPAPQEVVSRLLGLTFSEAQLAILLANGYSLTDAAVQAGLTESSARTYSKRIYAKLGINRQSELVRFVLQSVALLGAISPHGIASIQRAELVKHSVKGAIPNKLRNGTGAMSVQSVA